MSAAQESPVETEAPAAPAEVVVRARGLTKQYGKLTAVDGIDFEVAAGACFGFLGPNGAGKTSTMRMLYRVSPITSGSVALFGEPAGSRDREIKARIGVVPQLDNLDEELTVLETMRVYGRYHQLDHATILSRSADLLEFVELGQRTTSKVVTLSGGMRRRLLIARALISNPKLLFLDEPTTGLDPQVRHHIWERIGRLRSQGVTILLTTHYMEEAERLCDRLVVMNEGRIVASGSPRSLIAEHATPEVVEVYLTQRNGSTSSSEDVLAIATPMSERQVVLGDRVVLYTQDGRALVEALRPRDCLLRHGSLEDVFLQLTGRRLTE